MAQGTLLGMGLLQAGPNPVCAGGLSWKLAGVKSAGSQHSRMVLYSKVTPLVKPVQDRAATL